jgi:anti-sigma B factor antagonist
MHLVLNFELETESQGTSSLMRIRGDLDLQVVDQVTEAFTRVEEAGPALLAVDLSGVTFMDSSGMGTIAAAHIRANEAGCRFAIVRPPAGVRQAFDRTRLDEVITISDDLAAIYP